MDAPTACSWASLNPLMRDFHDHEWGEPVADADILFEYLVLHTFQLGFDFPVVLKRREGFRELLAGFDASRLARFGEAEIQELLLNPRILRNRRKLEATVVNAQAWLRLRRELSDDGSGAAVLAYFYGFVGGQPLDQRRDAANPVPPATPASHDMSQELKRRGFVMTGPVTCYNLMQTAGLVNDHLLSCPRHAACRALAADFTL